MNARQWADWTRRAGGVAFRVLGADGQITEIRVGQGQRRWSEAATSIMACDPHRVSALDAEGRVVRTWIDHEREGVEAPEPDAPSAPGTIDVNKIASLVLEATDRGAQRHAEAFRLAYESQGMLIQLFADRLSKLEQAWQAALEQRIADAAETTEDRIAEALVQRALAGPNTGEGKGH